MHYWRTEKNRFFSFLFIFSHLALISFSWAKENPRQITDATGVQVTLKDRPQRIVTLAPSLGELASDLVEGEMERIVGVSEFSDYPPRLKKVASIGPYHQFNLEKVLSLKPDLVLATTDGNPKDRVLQLRELGVPVVVINTESFQQMTASIQLAALSIGNSKLGEKMALQLTRGLEAIRNRTREKVRGKAPLKVLLQLSDDPLIVVGQKSFLHSALEAVGAQNVYSNSEAHYPKLSLEDVIHRNPDVIIVISLGENPTHSQQMAKKWNQFPILKAVQNHRVEVLQSDTLLKPTIRILEGLSLLERIFYGRK